MTSRKSVVFAFALPDVVAARAAAQFDFWQPERGLSPDKLVEAATERGAHAVMVVPGIPLDADHIARLPETVKVISTASVGFEHVDVKAANARGITVTSTPDAVTIATADTHMLLVLGACRRAKEHVRNMDSGWATRNGFGQGLGVEVTGKTMGIVGMGRIGRAVAQRARGFDMAILYHNRTRLSPELENGATYYSSLDEMLPHCQILSLNLPGGQGVLMTREKFAMLPKGAVFVNSARGSLVDEDALIEALKSGHLFGAGLDVFQQEPKYNQAINEIPTAFLTPHMGSATVETRNETGLRALANIEAVLAGKPALDEVRV